MLRRLAWSSVPSPSFSVARLNEIIAPARRNNERNHISGMLLFTGANFLEILEGGEFDLRDLWLRLERDRRHCDLLRIGDDLCGERWFPEWRIGYIVDAKVDAQIESLRSLKARIDLDRTRCWHTGRDFSPAVAEHTEVGGICPPTHVERRQHVSRVLPCADGNDRHAQLDNADRIWTLFGRAVVCSRRCRGHCCNARPTALRRSA